MTEKQCSATKRRRTYVLEKAYRLVMFKKKLGCLMFDVDLLGFCEILNDCEFSVRYF